MAEEEKEDKSKVFDKLSGTQKSAILMMLLEKMRPQKS